MRPERQLGLLWGGVAVLLVVLSPLGGRLVTAVPSCPIKAVVGLPCLTCGTTRAAAALARLDFAGSFSINPLAALSWMLLVGGGLVAGFLALWNVPIREPEWSLPRPVRWFLVVVFLANWAYLVRAGI